MPTMTMNTEWFKQKLAERKLSQRQLAKQIGLDPAAVSLMLRGQRKMTNEEANSIASMIGVAVTEVLRQAGVEVLDDVRDVPISAGVDDRSIVVLFPEHTHDRIKGPADCPAGTYAVQVQAADKMHDRWMLFVAPAKTEPEQIKGRICLVTVKDGTQYIGVMTRGYRTGTFNVHTWPEKVLIKNQEVAWASQVLWIKPE